MTPAPRLILNVLILLAALGAPLQGGIRIFSIQSSVASPQKLGTSVTWTVVAGDSNPGPLTFQFNVTSPGGAPAMLRDFNVGTLNDGGWTSLPFAWTPTKAEGTYQIQVVAKDFNSAESVSETVQFQVTPLVTAGKSVAVPTANPLVALFSAPSCAAGSSMRVWFQQQSKATPATNTNTVSCHPPYTMNFEIGGMYANTTYQMIAETISAGTVHDGNPVTFTTGSLPANVPFPSAKTAIAPGPQTDTKDSVLLVAPVSLTFQNNYPVVASDLAGSVIWYYYPSTADHFQLFTRPLPGGMFLSIQDDTAWDPMTQESQVLREVDLAGNIVRETNTGAIQQQLLALGSVDGGPCYTISRPAKVGAACLGSFHHDAIQTLPNGWTAVLADVERIFAPGTQGDTSGLPVDIIGDMILVLDTNWQVEWYFDSFQHAGGGTQLNLNRPAILGETCEQNQSGCQPMFLLGPGIAPAAKDWLHANSLYYNPQDGSIIWSSRHQDWVLKVDYGNGAGSAAIQWRMGRAGDFVFNNVYADPWPWFSHQHDVGIELKGTSVLTAFDNGNTRVSPAPLGEGSGDSRGMALNVDPGTMRVSPVLSVDLGIYSQALGSAQLLSNGDFFFLAPAARLPHNHTGSYSIEIQPTAGADTGTQVYSLVDTESYRAWRMVDLYSPPST